jgi:hypothetical protein
MAKIRLKHIHEFRDRHGKVRRYFRRPGWPRVALPGAPGSVEFMEAYQVALAGHALDERKPIGAGRSAPGSVSAAIAGYYCDASFLALSPLTRRARRSIWSASVPSMATSGSRCCNKVMSPS